MSNIINILVIEDNMVSASIISDILTEFQCNHAIAGTGKQAMLLANTTKYDLILLDIGLPDTNGFELAKHIREQDNLNQCTPIIALTAHDEAEHRENAERVAINDYMVKPFSIDKGKDVFEKYFSGEKFQALLDTYYLRF